MNFYDNVKTLEEHREATLKDVLHRLDKDSKVMCIRHTGYGKSYIMTNVMNKYKKKKHLVLVPGSQLKSYLESDVFKKYVACDCDVRVLLYSSLAKETNNGAYIRGMLSCFDFIHLDELHRVSADTYSSSVMALLDANTSAKIIGYTATLDRLDGKTRHIDIFSNSAVEEFSLYDSIASGYIPPIKYVSALYSVKKEQTELIERIIKSRKEGRIYLNEEIQLKKDVYDNYIASDLKEVVAEYLPTHRDINDTMRFVVFCPTIQSIVDTSAEVASWFKYALENAGVNKKVNIFALNSKMSSVEKTEAIEKFNSITNNAVNLIFTVNMLNEGVHFEHITGVVMLRGTASSNIYFQQLGRCIHPKDDSPLIFDFVSNYASVGEGYIDMIRTAMSKPKNTYVKEYVDISKALAISSHFDFELSKIREVEDRVRKRIEENYVSDSDKLKCVKRIFNTMIECKIDFVKACRKHGEHVGTCMAYVHYCKLKEEYDKIKSEYGLVFKLS